MAFDAVAEYIGVPRKNFAPCLEMINKQLIATYDSLVPFPGVQSAIEKLYNSILNIS